MGNVVVTSIGFLGVMGNKRMHVGILHLSTTYAAGGDSYTPSMFGMSSLEALIVPGGSLVFQDDHANSKIKAFYPTGGATAAPAAIANPIVTTGGATASAVDAVTPNITPGQGKEAAVNTDLSGVSIAFIALGS